MGFARFIHLWVWGAVKRSVGLGDFIAGMVGNVLTVILHFYPNYETAMSDLIWQIPLYGLAAAMFYRLIVTPYELWREAENRAASAHAEAIAPPWPNEVVHRFENDPIGDAIKRMSAGRDSRLAEVRQQRRDRFAATLANPMPNIDMAQALALITEKTGNIDERARSELHDLASAGQIRVWGRHFKKSVPNPLFPIPTEQWAELYPYWWSDGRKGVEDQSIAQRGSHLIYQDLRFCREQFQDYFERRGRNEKG